MRKFLLILTVLMASCMDYADCEGFLVSEITQTLPDNVRSAKLLGPEEMGPGTYVVRYKVKTHNTAMYRVYEYDGISVTEYTGPEKKEAVEAAVDRYRDSVKDEVKSGQIAGSAVAIFIITAFVTCMFLKNREVF